MGLHDLFEMEWSDPAFGKHWPTSVRRSVIKRFIKGGCSTQWVTQALQELDDSVPVETDVSGRVGDCVEHAEAWAEVGGLTQARRFLELAIETSFGVGYRKDYQMNHWIKLLGDINEIAPANAAERISQFAHGIRDLEEAPTAGSYPPQPLYSSRPLFAGAPCGPPGYFSGSRINES